MIRIIDMLRSPRAKKSCFFRSHESIREQVIRSYPQFTFKKTVDIITLFFSMLQLSRAAATNDLASGVDCNMRHHFFFADEFRPLHADISKYFLHEE